MRLLAALVALCVSCGHEDPRRPPRRAPDPAATAPGGAASPPRAGAPLTLYPKVPADLRAELRAGDFLPDVIGDANRDPFRAYLQPPGTPPPPPAGANPCVANERGLAELELDGIILRGTRSYALLTDGAGQGYTVHRGDCVADEQARVKTVASDRIVLERNGPAGFREEVWVVQ